MSVSKGLMYTWITALVVSIVFMILVISSLGGSETTGKTKEQAIVGLLSWVSWVVFFLTFIGWLITLGMGK